MRLAPRGHRLEPLPFVPREREVGLADRANTHVRHLHHRDGPAIVVDERQPLAHLGQRFAVTLVVDEEARRRRLLPAQDRADELAAERRPREAELELLHASWVSSPLTPQVSESR